MATFNRVQRYFSNPQPRFVTQSAAFAVGSSSQLLGDQLSFAVPETPENALTRLKAGNERFASGFSITGNRELERSQANSEKQRPFAVFLSCSDFLIPIETVFDQEYGDFFVTQIGGNAAITQSIGSLEYGTQLLGAKVLFILGHTGCGTIDAMMRGVKMPGQSSELQSFINPAIKIANGDLNDAVFANVRNQAALIADASPVISKLLQNRELVMAGGVYVLETGVVEPVESLL